MNIIDSLSWIEHFVVGSNADFFSSPMQNTDTLLVRIICLHEVLKKANFVEVEAKGKKPEPAPPHSKLRPARRCFR